jgi:hypothetical protein
MNRIGTLARTGATVLAAILGVAACAGAQTQPVRKEAVFSPPRLTDGTPDFRGIWGATGTIAYASLEGVVINGSKEPEVQSIVVDPPDGKIPYLPEAQKQLEENRKDLAAADPASNCYQAGVPRAVLMNTPFQIVQSPGNFAFVYTDNHSYRIVEPDTIPHDDGIDFFMGDSRGHWEGNTLVVDVTDLGDQTWFDRAGHFHSDQLHVVERYTMTGPDTIVYEARLEDPKTLSRPFTIRTALGRYSQSPESRIYEDECLEGPDGRWHHMYPYDEKALKHHDYKAELAAEAQALAAAAKKQ